MKISNPFLVYGYVSPEYFCDRREETGKLISALRNGRNITLMSPRRMGKTGLIKNAFYELTASNPDAQCFYVDIYATKSLADFTRVFGEAVLSKMDTLSQKARSLITSVLTHCKISYSSDSLLGGQVSLEFSDDDAEPTLRDIFSYLLQCGNECFIAIDEFQQIAEYKEENMEALLRTYIQQCPMLHFVFSGSKNHLMSAIFDSPRRPFFRSTEKMHLGVIPEETYYEFASRHLSKTMTILPKEMFTRIYDIFCGHTWYVQYVLNKIYEQSPAVVDDTLVKECIVDVVRSNAEDYQKLCSLLTVNQLTLLRAIGQERNVEAINSSAFIAKYKLKGSSSVNKALKYLLDNEYVYHYEDGYQVYDRFMSLWIERNV